MINCNACAILLKGLRSSAPGPALPPRSRRPLAVQVPRSTVIQSPPAPYAGALFRILCPCFVGCGCSSAGLRPCFLEAQSQGACLGRPDKGLACPAATDGEISACRAVCDTPALRSACCLCHQRCCCQLLEPGCSKVASCTLECCRIVQNMWRRYKLERSSTYPVRTHAHAARHPSVSGAGWGTEHIDGHSSLDKKKIGDEQGKLPPI